MITNGTYSKRHLMEVLLPAILVEIMCQCDQYQHVRLSRSWVKNRSGRVKLIRPVTLPVDQYFQWVRQQAYRRFGEFVTNESSQRTGFAVPMNNELEDPREKAIEPLIAAEREGLPQSMVEEIETQLPRKQRRYFRTLLETLSETDSITEARKKTARRLKISGANERQLWKRVKKSCAPSPSTHRKRSYLIH
jgi:hypothetical protein